MNENYIRERIFELIDASDISASHLCEELHLNKGYFADVRREKQGVPYDILVRICELAHYLCNLYESNRF